MTQTEEYYEQDRALIGPLEAKHGGYFDGEVRVGVDAEEEWQPSHVRLSLADWNTGEEWAVEQVPAEEALALATALGEIKSYDSSPWIVSHLPSVCWLIHGPTGARVLLSRTGMLRVAQELSMRA